MLIFQPAEERATGAKAMLRDGLFAGVKPVAIYAVHTAPLEVGSLGTRAGGMMAGRDFIEVKVSGTGDLKTAADSVVRLIQSVSTLTLAQALQPASDDQFILTQARREDDGSVSGSATVASSAARERAKQSILQGVSRIRLTGVTLEPSYEIRAIAGVTNDSALTDRANRSIQARLGPNAVTTLTTIVPAFSEDYGSFEELMPGVFYFLGVSNTPKGIVGMPHSPGYVADEAAILVGARAMAAAMVDRLAEGR
jgi:metal-dependent amidase/aminoacylase/carboxypeptidase family protein